MKLKRLVQFLFSCTLFSQLSSAFSAEFNVSEIKDWASKRNAQAQKDFSQKVGNYQPSPSFWGQQVVYQIQVDRFNNGDFNNDDKNVEEQQIKETATKNLYGILDYRHGGDLQGIIDRLDYIKDLGITSLWITPIFKHNGSYHGYCTTDFTEVDPGFGSNEKLRELVQLSHKKGIKVILDIVVNHMCDAQTSYAKQPDHLRCSDDLNRKNWNGEAGGSDAQGTLNFSSAFFAPLKSQYFFNRCGANSQADMEGTGPAAVYGDFVNGMFDFDTRNQDFQNIFTDIHKFWIAYADIDGYRMDAVKHVSEDFIAYFSTEIRKYAKQLGKNNFFIVGEVAGPSDWIGRRLGTMYSDPVNPNNHGNVPQTLTNRLWDLKETYLSHSAAPYPGLNSAYDFAHGGIARDVLQNKKSPAEIEGHFNGSYHSDISHQNDYRLSWNLLEIHDWPRFAGMNINSMEKSKLGISYLALAEGSPIIYYGQEQGFNGDCHFDTIDAGDAAAGIKQTCKGYSHALFRQDMFQNGWTKLGSTVPSINSMAKISRPSTLSKVSWQQDPFLDRSHDLYQTSRKLLNIRNSCNGLKFGSTTFRWMDSSNAGIMAFSRIDPNGHEVVAVLNTAYEARGVPTMPVADFRNGHRWINLLNTKENAWTDGSGKLNFNGLALAPNSVMVLVPEENMGVFSESAQTYLCKN